MPGRRPRWGLFIVPVILLILAVAVELVLVLCGLARSKSPADAWRAQEAKSGRIYDCAKRSIAGFPFRFEVQCSGASVALVSQNASKTPFTAQARQHPGRRPGLRSQARHRRILRALVMLTDGVTQNTSPVVNWSKGRSSVFGLPAVPDRASHRVRRSRHQSSRRQRAGAARARQAGRAARSPSQTGRGRIIL